MQAMVFSGPGTRLVQTQMAPPRPNEQQVLIRVSACAVCRTDLHIIDSELPDPKLPLIPRHEIVWVVIDKGARVDRFALGDRVGVPWLEWTCGFCDFCRAGRENLCDRARFPGYQIDGGFAEQAVADQCFCFALPTAYGDVEAAPFRCAGLIEYRALRLAGPARRLGLYGFGAAARIVAQMARYQGREIYAFTRPGETLAEQFARDIGARWAGGSDTAAPEPLDAALIFAPVGSLVPVALRAVAKGGTVAYAGIHMSDIPGVYGDRPGPRNQHAAYEENIAYGKPGATRDEVVLAAKLANADEFISRLPKGYDCVLGERRHAIRRAAAAYCDCARHHSQRAHPPVGRAVSGPRSGVGSSDLQGAVAPHGGQDVDYDRPPPGHGSKRRRDLRAGQRSHLGARDARRAPGTQWALRAPLPYAVSSGRCRRVVARQSRFRRASTLASMLPLRVYEAAPRRCRPGRFSQCLARSRRLIDSRVRSQTSVAMMAALRL
jgi:propanol-preferring alcohol dehydrogenase